MKFLLAASLNIYEYDDEPIFFGCEEGGIPKLIVISELKLAELELIVFNAPPIIEYLRCKNLGLPKSFIDILQMFKLINGRPAKYHKLPIENVLHAVFNIFGVDNNDLKEVVSILNQSPSVTISNKQENKIFPFISYLTQSYKILENELDKRNERTRFENIEKPFDFILACRQYFGVHVDLHKLNAKNQAIDRELSILNKRIRYEFNIFSPQNTYEVKEALKKKNFLFLTKMSDTVEKSSFWNFVKTGAEQNDFLKLLHEAYRVSLDKKSLIKIFPDVDGKVYPVFDCCGTVTSRALIRTPHIQQLKKSSRDIFSSKKDYELLYADYSQFEPGILASLSNDDNLIDCYNQEDIYTSLSISLFQNAELRSFCKIIFLSFMYGMSNVGLENLLADFFPDSAADKKEVLKKFFDKFTNLKPFKAHLQEIALKEKRICSCLGNYRYIDNKSDTHLPNKVKRWVLSQKIQGTASLILKTAIINCCADEQIEFLVPMHDAALFQVPSNLLDEKKIKIKSEFEKAMLKYCPTLQPKVSFKKFTE